MKKFFVLTLFILIAGVFAGCGQEEENSTIRIGATFIPHSEILEQAASILAEEGIVLDIVVITDPTTTNIALNDGSLDANYFQHRPFLGNFNSENNATLTVIGSVHYEPFGVYAGRTASLEELADGATVAVPNNVANAARALHLLEAGGLITLREDAGVLATVLDIADNPRNLQFIDIAPQQLVRSLPDVDVAVINGNFALEGGLHVRDALLSESPESNSAQLYSNILVTREENANDPHILRLMEVLQSDAIVRFINETYDGAVVPIH